MTNKTISLFSLNPYIWVLKTRIIKGFTELNKGNYQYLVSLFADDVHYTFEGDHTLGGTRTSKVGVELWFERLLRLLPCQFIINAIYVSGTFWNTTAVIEFTDTVTPQFGPQYLNNGIQVVQLRWGKVNKIHTYVNTHKVINALTILYNKGILEAKANIITN